ncbi:oxygen-dependent coproporphyrinogen oxidase [Portibacter marinus]|uniref:oxygen-dependent coproporphyrinogen oxidase n=1 Tax=Portibacter marinus TaxID=2898660 RepID=UPI001F2A0053|nr:oxygen-dependent coproporphyrinogen oxidase [Portibacter marinus]
MIKDRFEKKIKLLQKEIVGAFLNDDPDLILLEDEWERPGGGGGFSNILSNGKYIEKGGVNISMVHGELPEEMKERLHAKSATFYASGISLVIHPLNPFVPTVHFNIRYFELYESDQMVDSWFGGGMDMTPYYIFEEDPIHFHQVLKSVCDQFNGEFYPTFKPKCDEYFYNAHRDEHRGVGGIFYDYLKGRPEFHLAFTSAVGDAFLKAYMPIFQKRKDNTYDEHHKEWQEIRRGRYVEFNLIHDRGTLFGLKTNGRTESILMSLPPTVRWVYNHHPAAGSAEAQLLKALKPRDWASENINL